MTKMLSTGADTLTCKNCGTIGKFATHKTSVSNGTIFLALMLIPCTGGLSLLLLFISPKRFKCNVCGAWDDGQAAVTFHAKKVSPHLQGLPINNTFVYTQYPRPTYRL